MRYFSTFSGIGGFELGIHKAIPDTECVGYSEIDKHAIKTYKKHFPGHKNYGDITKINAALLPKFDLFVGGFPCQSFSIAGKRLGFEDTRGTLFFDIARIIKECRPQLILLENVKGLLSHDNGRTFATILATLDELGYNVEWQVLNSKHFGVPQNRERVFIVGHIRGSSGQQIFPIREKNSRINERTSKTPVARCFTAGGNSGGMHSSMTLIQVVGGLQKNASIMENCSPALTQAMANGGGHIPIIIPEATKQGYSIAEPGDSINLAVPNSKTRRGRVGKGIAQTLDTGMQQHTLTNSRIRRLTPIECERLQGFPDNWTIGSDTQRYKQCGNAVTVNVIEVIMNEIKPLFSSV